MRLLARNERGFTLIELLVVILIIAILIAVSAPSFLGQTQKAHDSVAKQYLAIVYKEAKAEAASQDSGNYPSVSALVSAITISEPSLTVAAGSCPGSADSNPKHVFIDSTYTSGTSIKLCNDPTHTVWMLTSTNGGPPLFSSTGVSTSPAPPSTYSQAVIVDTPVGYWRLNDSATTAINQGSASGLNGTYTGGYTHGQAPAVSDYTAAATLFNGSSGYVSLGSSSALKQTGPFSLEAWFKTTSSGREMIYRWAYNGALLYLGAPPSGALVGDSGGGGRVSFSFYDNSAAPDLFTVSSTATYNDGQWHHAVGVYSGGSTGTISLYIDGSLQNTVSYTQPIYYNTSLAPVGAGIGDAGLTGSDCFAGALEDVALYGQALSQGQILNHYSARNNVGSGEPTPFLSSVSPSTVASGSGAFTLTVNGTNLLAGSTVKWDGTALTTSYVSASQLTAAVPSSFANSLGSHSVTVVQPLGTTSATQTVTVAGPQLSSLSPNSAIAGGAGFTLAVNGANFTTGSTIKWDGTARTTTYASSSQLTTAISSSDIASSGSHAVTVQNPDGTTSAALTFTVGSQTYNQIVQADQPVGYWRMDDLSGTSVSGSDYSSGSAVTHNGTYTAAVSSTSGASVQTVSGTTSDSDKAIAFNGGWGTVSNYSDLNPAAGQGLTMEFWYKGAPPTDQNHYALMKGYATTAVDPYYEYGVSIYNGYFLIPIDTCTAACWTASAWEPSVPWPANDGNWHYIVVTYNLSTIRLYVDDVLKGSVARTGNVNVSSASPGNLGIMDLITYGANDNVVGSIDEVAIYNKALSCDTTTTGQSCSSASQIGKHYSSK